MNLTKGLRIFLLHARSDEEAVRRLYRRLTDDGADVWLDRERLLPGQDWVYEIHQAIRASDIVIACLSRQFNRQGGFRHEELKLALRQAKTKGGDEIFLIPARLEPCDLPAALSRWQRVDLFDAHGYKKLLGALEQASARYRVKSPYNH